MSSVSAVVPSGLPHLSSITPLPCEYCRSICSVVFQCLHCVITTYCSRDHLEKHREGHRGGCAGANEKRIKICVSLCDKTLTLFETAAQNLVRGLRSGQLMDLTLLGVKKDADMITSSLLLAADFSGNQHFYNNFFFVLNLTVGPTPRETINQLLKNFIVNRTVKYA